nr:hypothetical protein [Prevotella sp.]
MKRICMFLLTMLSIVSFTGCDKTDEHNGPGTDYDNLFDKTYTINNDGCCVLEDCEPTIATVVEDEVKGYGWKVIGMYKVQDNGRLSQTNYLYTGNGGGYMDYWFESDGHLIGFQHGDTYGKLYNKTEWFYDAVTGFIMRGSASQSIQNRYMQVLSVVTLQRKESNKFYMYTLQKLGDATIEHDNLKPFYGMVVYQRMTDNELAETKKAYDYDANIDFTDAVPNDCKFRVSASYNNPDDFEENTNGSVIVAFGNVKFSLTDYLGTSMLPNPALEYFDSIVWSSDNSSLPDRYVVHRHKPGQAQTALTWTTRFFDTNTDLTSYFAGYKKGRVVYIYTMHHNVYNDKFLCFDWGKFSMSKPREFAATCLLDKSRSFTVYEPRTYNNDMNKVYAELRYNYGEKGKGNDVAILQKEARELTELMINHYGKGTEVGKQVDHYRTLFKALPEKAHIITYWATADTRIALVLNRDDADSKNDYFYVHAEPVN